jgi:hypothetical protein
MSRKALPIAGVERTPYIGKREWAEPGFRPLYSMFDRLEAEAGGNAVAARLQREDIGEQAR